MKRPAQRADRDHQTTTHATDELGREQPPMPSTFFLAAAIRNLGSTEIPVARIEFKDVLGDTRTMDFDAPFAFNLALELLKFYGQVTGN